MKRTYEVASATDKRAMAEFMKREGQFLLPMVELVERTELAIDEVIQVMGRATIGLTSSVPIWYLFTKLHTQRAGV